MTGLLQRHACKAGKYLPCRLPGIVVRDCMNRRLERSVGNQRGLGSAVARVKISFRVDQVGNPPILSRCTAGIVVADPVISISIYQAGEAAGFFLIKVGGSVNGDCECIHSLVCAVADDDLVRRGYWRIVAARRCEVDLIVARSIGCGCAGHKNGQAPGCVGVRIVTGRGIKLKGGIVCNQVSGSIHLDNIERIGSDRASPQ